MEDSETKGCYDGSTLECLNTGLLFVCSHHRQVLQYFNVNVRRTNISQMCLLKTEKPGHMS